MPFWRLTIAVTLLISLCAAFDSDSSAEISLDTDASPVFDPVDATVDIDAPNGVDAVDAAVDIDTPADAGAASDGGAASSFGFSGFGSNIGMAGFGEGRTENIDGTAAINSDIKYIRCEICNLVGKQAYRQTKAAEKELKPGKKLSEIKIIEKLEKLTNPDHDEGEWVAEIDLVESGDKLLVKEMGKLGKCGVECKTVEKAAAQIVDGIDTDMAEKLWQGDMSRSQFTNWLCQEATDSCRRKPPPLPKDRPEGEEFVEGNPEEAKMQRMMSTMKEMGMGGQVFNRDQAKKMADGEEYDDYGDDSNPKPEAPPQEEAEGEDDDSSETADTPSTGVGEAVKNGWETTKQAGKDILNKASGLLGSDGSSTEPAEPKSTEL